MESVLLDKQRHQRKSFDCGIPALNHFLQQQANQQDRKYNARTWVLSDESKPECIRSFYTLTLASLDLSVLPEALQRKHQSASSAGLIARLAVNKADQGQGLGEWLLLDALKRLLDASDLVGFPLILVDAKDGASEFYQAYGFAPFPILPNRLFMTVADLRSHLTE